MLERLGLRPLWRELATAYFEWALDSSDLRDLDDLEVGREVRFSNALSLVVVRRIS